MGFETKTKDPDAILDYMWPWSANGWLTAGDIITDATFTVYTADGVEIPDDSGSIPDGSDLTPVVVDDSSFTDTDATAWLSGGTLGNTYLIVNHITTDGGREDDRTLKLKIVQK